MTKEDKSITYHKVSVPNLLNLIWVALKLRNSKVRKVILDFFLFKYLLTNFLVQNHNFNQNNNEIKETKENFHLSRILSPN
jgi:hypothetical protein